MAEHASRLGHGHRTRASSPRLRGASPPPRLDPPPNSQVPTPSPDTSFPRQPRNAEIPLDQDQTRSYFNCRVPEYLAILLPAAPPVMAGRGHLARQNFRMRTAQGNSCQMRLSWPGVDGFLYGIAYSVSLMVSIAPLHKPRGG